MAVARMNGRSPAMNARNSQGSIFEHPGHPQKAAASTGTGAIFKGGQQYQQFASASVQGHNMADGDETQGGMSNPNAPPSQQAAL